jgi:hypothetical protein
VLLFIFLFFPIFSLNVTSSFPFMLCDDDLKVVKSQSFHSSFGTKINYITNLTHYEKSCLPKPHYPTTRTPKQLLCNYIITKTWKYRWLIKECNIRKSINYIVITTYFQMGHIYGVMYALYIQT